MMRKLPSISISNTRRTQRAGEEYMKLFLAGKRLGELVKVYVYGYLDG